MLSAGQPSADVRCRRFDRPGLFSESLHAHEEAIFIYAPDSVFHLLTERAIWLSTPDMGVWIPAGALSGAQTLSAPAKLRPLHFHGMLPGGLPGEIVALRVSPLLAGLMDELSRLSKVDAGRARVAAVELLILHEIADAAELPFRLPLPKESHLRRAAAAASGAGRALTTREAASVAGMSIRTFARRFPAETGLSWAQWSRELRLLEAKQQIEAGAAIGQVALDFGWESPSAFAAAFRKRFGFPPRLSRARCGPAS